MNYYPIRKKKKIFLNPIFPSYKNPIIVGISSNKPKSKACRKTIALHIRMKPTKEEGHVYKKEKKKNIEKRIIHFHYVSSQGQK